MFGDGAVEVYLRTSLNIFEIKEFRRKSKCAESWKLKSKRRRRARGGKCEAVSAQRLPICAKTRDPEAEVRLYIPPFE
jgi:hypothetical protein